MTAAEAAKITDLSGCDFTHIHRYFVQRSEEKKALSKEEKQKLKAENESILAEYGWAVIDGHRERIGNFKTEPPGLFRGRGDHPKQGRIKVSDRLTSTFAHPPSSTLALLFSDECSLKMSPLILVRMLRFLTPLLGIGGRRFNMTTR